MFGQIAPWYDFLNHALSLNIDKRWRTKTTKLVPPLGAEAGPILDLCTGTGDLALAYNRAAKGAVPIIAADFCHEIELVVAIGRGGRHIDPADVEQHHIWGYAAGLDLTRRDLQQQAKRTGGPWEPAKAFDSSAPCTALTPASVCGHPRQGAVWLQVNGIERQRGDVSELLWSVPELVSMLSQSVSLQPGDLVYTGTPAGVGPLHPGDVVSAGIAGIGELTLTVGSAQSQ